MASAKPPGPDGLEHADLSSRKPEELSAAERAELKRRYENFMQRFRAGALNTAPAGGRARRIRKWTP